MTFEVDDQQFTVTILDSGDSFRCKTSQTLLDAMVAVGRSGLPSGCHGDGCGVCQIFIRQGAVDTLPLSRAPVSEAEEQRGYSLAYRPLSLVRYRGGKSKVSTGNDLRVGFGRPCQSVTNGIKKRAES